MKTAADEMCGNPDRLICYPLRTKTGRVLTSEDLDALVEEAERGYDVGTLRVLRVLRSGINRGPGWLCGHQDL
jgi:hypothetical protein